MTIAALAAVAAGVSAALHAASGTNVQSAGRTVWDGVFSRAQVTRGLDAYREHCAACHGDDLAGDSARAIAGAAFVDEWREDTVDSLFTRVQQTMPRGAPRSLPERTYADVIAYLLARNGFPEGDAELAPDALADIRIEGRDGPQPPPNFSLVVSMGCLARDGMRWHLTQATAPRRTREPEATLAPEARDALAKAPAGALTFQLEDVHAGLGATVGHRAEVRGLLIRQPAGDRLSVTGVQTLPAPCTP